MTQKGRLYGVGVGPGDPELLTVKAVRLLKACDVIAIPQKDSEKCVALKIAAGAAPEALATFLFSIFNSQTTDRHRYPDCQSSDSRQPHRKNSPSTGVLPLLQQEQRWDCQNETDKPQR